LERRSRGLALVTVALCAVLSGCATFPWNIVPALLVPLYLLIHLTIAAKLRLWSSTAYTVAMAR
jgi:hypothetical protein